MPNVVYASATSGSAIWSSWVDSSTMTTTSCTVAASSNIIWQTWNFTTNATMGTGLTKVWREWNSTTSGTCVTLNSSNQQHFVTETAEQKAKRIVEDRKRKIRLRLKRAKIRRTAEAMLKSLCTPEQWRLWVARKAIRHIGRKGIFEINPAMAGELYMLDHAGEPKEKFCVHADYTYPVEDRAAALLLALRADEDAVLRIANRPSFNEREKERLKLGRIRMVEYQLN